MGLLGYDRYLSELVAETDQFADAVLGIVPGVTVPTCPDWTVETLAEHLGQAHRWAHAIVSRRATIEIPDKDVEDAPDWAAPAEIGERDTWLRVGARRLAAAIEEAGPHTPVWTWDDTDHSAGYWARRMTHETIVHRADAAGAAGEPFTTAPDLAADTITEWLEIVARAVAHGEDDAAALRGAGETLRLRAVDEGLGADGQWLITRGPDGVAWEHGEDGGPGRVTLTGKAVDLMLVMNRRALRTDRDVRLDGDAALLDHWLDHTRF